MTMRLIDVSVREGEHARLEDVTVELAAGAVIHVLADAGGGKSTFLRVAGGLQRPTSGKVAGLPRRGALLVDATSSPPPRQTALHRWLDAAVRMAQGQPAPSLEEVAVALGLREELDTPLERLPSAKAAVAVLAAAILAAPSTLLLDEPASALPLHEMASLRPALHRLLATREGTTLVAARQAEEMLSADGEVVVLAQGRLLQRGTCLEVAARPRSLRVASVCHVPRLNMIQILRRADTVMLGPQLALPAPQPLASLPEGRWTLALPADRATLQPFQGAMVLPAKVEMVETDGGVRRLTTRVGRASWRLVLPTSRRPSPGEALAIHVDPADFLVFGDTGLLERMPGDPAAVAA